MFIIFNIILNILYYMFYAIKYVIVNLFGLNSTIIDSVLSFISNKLNNVTLDSTSLNTTKDLDFNDLYSEYSFYNNTKNIKLNDFLVNNAVNTSLIQNYSSDLNLLIDLKNNDFGKSNSYKKNLNYVSNAMVIDRLYSSFNKSYLNSKYSFNSIKLSLVHVSDKLVNSVNSNWVIKYSPSNFIKYIKSVNLNKYTILFLRKNKVFNKGRYSRNRQYYRTGVYWCLYVNIVAVVGIYFWFYKITMNFGYLWWLLYAFIASFIVPKTIKYRLYNLKVLFNNYVSSFIWLYNILLNIVPLKSLVSRLFANLYRYINSNIFNLNNSSNIFLIFINYVLNISNLLISFVNDNKNSSNKYIYTVINSNKK